MVDLMRGGGVSIQYLIKVSCFLQVVVVYNSLGWRRTDVVRIPVSSCILFCFNEVNSNQSKRLQSFILLDGTCFILDPNYFTISQKTIITEFSIICVCMCADICSICICV